MSRDLKPTRPVSSLLIFEPDARITYPASSRVICLASRSRRSWAPSMMRSAVGAPAPDEAIIRWTAAVPSGRRGAMSFLLGTRDHNILPLPLVLAPTPAPSGRNLEEPRRLQAAR